MVAAIVAIDGAALEIRNAAGQKRRAAEAGVSAAELHRRILRQALLSPRRSGAELVAALRRLGELGLEIEPDRRSAPLRVEL